MGVHAPVAPRIPFILSAVYILTAGFDYGLYYFTSKGTTYVLYITNEENQLTKLSLDAEIDESSAEPSNHNFTTLGGNHVPSFNESYAYIQVGRDIIEVGLDTESPLVRRTHRNEWQEKERFVQDHKVNRRDGIISGEFVTVNSTKHYFCYIPYMQQRVYCRVIEDYIITGNGGEKIIEFSSTPEDFYLSSEGNRLIGNKCVGSKVYQVFDEPLY